MIAILEKAIELPIGERIRLVEELWVSIDNERRAIDLSPEQEAELNRRIADYRVNPGGNYSWEEIKAEVLA